MTSLYVILMMIGIAAVTAAGDYFLKVASQQETSMFNNRWFVAGVIIYAVCAFGWVLAMRHMKLATIGVVYSVSTILILAALGVIAFGETLNRYEITGIGFAIFSIVLLARFGD